jgi:hypothetical protein
MLMTLADVAARELDSLQRYPSAATPGDRRQSGKQERRQPELELEPELEPAAEGFDEVGLSAAEIESRVVASVSIESRAVATAAGVLAVMQAPIVTQ